MKNINFGKQGGFRNKGNFLPRQTKKQMKRMRRIEKRVLAQDIMTQKQQEFSSLGMKMSKHFSDAALLAACLLVPKKRGGF